MVFTFGKRNIFNSKLQGDGDNNNNQILGVAQIITPTLF